MLILVTMAAALFSTAIYTVQVIAAHEHLSETISFNSVSQDADGTDECEDAAECGDGDVEVKGDEDGKK